MSTSCLEVSLPPKVDLGLVANPNDFIEIKFDVDTVDNLLGLHSYMNTMLNTNDDVIRYQLRKISHYWGYREQGSNFVYYMLAPPWLKIYIVSSCAQLILSRMTLSTNPSRRRLVSACRGQSWARPKHRKACRRSPSFSVKKSRLNEANFSNFQTHI